MEKRKIKMPACWDDITVGVYEELCKISNDKTISDYKREVKIIALLSGLSEADINGLEINEFKKLSDGCAFMMNKIEPRMPIEKIKLNGVTYNISLYPLKLKAGQFLDYKSLMANADIDKRMARLLACFFVPEGHKYADDKYDVDTVVNDINEHLSIVEGVTLSNFFTLQFKAFAEAFLHYSEMEIKKSKLIQKPVKKSILTKMKELKDTLIHIG